MNSVIYKNFQFHKVVKGVETFKEDTEFPLDHKDGLEIRRAT